MATFFGEVRQVTSRAFYDDDDDDEEECSPAIQYNVKVELNNAGDEKVPNVEAVVISCGKLATDFCETLILSEKCTNIGSLIVEVQGQTDCEDTGDFHPRHPAPSQLFVSPQSLLVCCVSKDVTPTVASQFAQKLLGLLKLSCVVMVLSSHHYGALKGSYEPQGEDNCVVHSLHTPIFPNSPVYPRLPQPATLDSVPAAVLTESLVSRRPCVAYPVFTETYSTVMVKKVKKVALPVIGTLHQFTENEVEAVREKLLKWYDTNKRTLPWRSIAATEPDRNKRAYAVWVSEIMLQQTQVSTVVSYFEKWMTKWPTVTDLACATLEEVNQVWAGLGYYSRARRLHEGAVKVVNELDCEFPDDRDSLIHHLPGIGRYSGSAIASIALGCGVGVVDGNVNRVLARVRGIGADIAAQSTMEHMWSLANQLVDPDRPGDFNQALMELGATVCTPKTPACSLCPLRVHCVAYYRSEDVLGKTSITNHFKKSEEKKTSSGNSAAPDIECISNCDLCLRKEDWDGSLGVQNYPRKAQKTQSRQESSAVIILQGISGKMLLVQRPKAGLLANLWEFPSIPLTDSDSDQGREVTEQLVDQFAIPKSVASSRTFVTDVIHIFSHIRQTYKVYKISFDVQQEVTWPSRYQGGQWMTKQEFLTSATSTAMKKVLKAVEVSEDKSKSKKTKVGPEGKSSDTKKQRTISQFFSAAPKKM